jgi:predicted esterase
MPFEIWSRTMRSLAGLVVAAFALLVHAPAALAQEPAKVDEYFKAQKKGVDAIQAAKYEDGIAAFQRCLELVPKDATTAYNLACIHSLKKELDPAFEWLGKAVAWNFALIGDDELALLETKDADLANLRADPRFAPLVEKLKARRKASLESLKKPLTYVPESLKGAASLPLLVVLHDAGATKEAALEKGPWKRLADELGYALLFPSARCLVGDDPSAGVRWFDQWFAWADKTWTYEKGISDAIDLFQKEHAIDAAKTYVVGEGQGGAVAFSVALTSPGRYKGVISLDSTILAGTTFTAKARTAAGLGLKAKLLLPDAGCSSPVLGSDAADAIAKEIAALEKAIAQVGLAPGIERYARKADDPEQRFGLIKAALEGFAPPAPAPDSDSN